MDTVTFAMYDAYRCPACGSDDISIEENFDQTYLVTNQCKVCLAWWTAMYVLDSVYVRDTPYPEGTGELLPGQPPTHYTGGKGRS